MYKHELNFRFTEESVSEPELIQMARHQSNELGIQALAPTNAAHIAAVAAASQPRNIIEFGTGVGVSGLWVAHGAPKAHITSIDIDPEKQRHAKSWFTKANIPTKQIRFIADDAMNVLPRMSEQSYDLALIDANPEAVLEYVEHALRLIRPGGTVLVARALWKGLVSDPASRDDIAFGFRTIITEISHSPAVLSTLCSNGDGLLHITTRATIPSS